MTLPIDSWMPRSSPSASGVARLLVLLLTGCAGSLEDPDRFTQTADAGTGCPPGTTAAAILQERCLSCHSASVQTGGLDLESAGLPGRLYTANSSSCAQPRPMADSQNPSASYFLQKLEEHVPCGTRMPQGGALSTAEVACLAGWLAQGKPGAP